MTTRQAGLPDNFSHWLRGDRARAHWTGLSNDKAARRAVLQRDNLRNFIIKIQRSSKATLSGVSSRRAKLHRSEHVRCVHNYRTTVSYRFSCNIHYPHTHTLLAAQPQLSISCLRTTSRSVRDLMLSMRATVYECTYVCMYMCVSMCICVCVRDGAGYS